MCQMFDTVERDVHCRVSPREGLLEAMGIWIVLVLCPYRIVEEHSIKDLGLRTLALQRPKVTVLPAQFLIS